MPIVLITDSDLVIDRSDSRLWYPS